MRTQLSFGLLLLFVGQAVAQVPAPVITNFNVSGAQKNIRFAPYPAAEAYTLLSASHAGGVFTADTNFFIAPYTNIVVQGTNSVTNVAYEWRATNNAGSSRLYRLQVNPLSASNVLGAIALSRLTYGPTPDELQNLAANGPDAFIAQQLAPWNITETAEAADTGIATLGAKLAAFDEPITTNHAPLPEFRAWHVLRAVTANRQLLEVMLQFWENHFVTEYAKSYNSSPVNPFPTALRYRLAAQMEYAENQRWRAALLNPQCTFYDLLKISAESPAMIIYLDTHGSRGDGSQVANENYARELLELFCFGVDNGYDQNDITIMSQAWTGWRVRLVHPTNALNIFAPQSLTTLDGSITNLNITNLYGVYAFNYQSNFHKNSIKTIFPGKTVPARFGSPWAGDSYQLVLNNGLSNSTNTVRDGYQVIQHMADQPFTQEYLSIKLCRLLVHDNFPNPTTNPQQTNDYNFYDYTRSDLSPEAQLVHACMMTWENSNPKGQIWPVLKTITDSDLFRSQAAAQQKVKTPLEFTVSAIRALRASTNGTGLDGSFTADTDGLAISGSNLDNTDGDSPLLRMGNMLIFDRDAPDGYPEDAPPWISAGTLAERIRWIQSYCVASGQEGHSGSVGSKVNDAGNSVCHPVRLLQAKLPAASWTNATPVADYFVKILYPGEGAGNLQLYRDAAVNFLNTSDTGTASPFSSLTVSSTAGQTYDTRVRGMVGMLMTFQRFHEQ